MYMCTRLAVLTATVYMSVYYRCMLMDKGCTFICLQRKKKDILVTPTMYVMSHYSVNIISSHSCFVCV